MTKRKLILTLGPLVLAALLAVLLFFSPLSITPNYSQAQLDQFAVNPNSPNTFTGYSVKQQAFSESKYLPILGSSELEKFDPYHPSVFSEKYHTSYTPYLAGQPGTQSLPLLFYVNSVSSELSHRKMVVIISPQWFVPDGIKQAALANFVSKGELYTWMSNADPTNQANQVLAQRLLDFPDFNSDLVIKNSLSALAKGKSLSKLDKFSVDLAHQFWSKEDLTFSSIKLGLDYNFSGLAQIKTLAKSLPAKLDFNQLTQFATETATKETNNNPFNIKNSIWNHSIKKKFKRYRQSQKLVNYLNSPEYTDFQLLLNQLAVNHNDVQFIIQPVNGKWADYTGLSQTMLQQFTNKITTQLKSQGFNRIADLSVYNNQPYYVGDSIHMGYLGWVATDKVIYDFMMNQGTDLPNYQLDNQRFLSAAWRNQP